MADERIVTNIVANADFSDLIANVNRVTASLSKLQQQIIQSDVKLTNQVALVNRSFAESLRRTGQFSTHFVTLTSDVEKFGKNLDGGKLKLRDYFRTFQEHTKTSGGLIRELAKQQVALQNAVIQPLGKNAEGLMQYNVHIPQGLNEVKNKTALARQELAIMNRVIQDGGVQLINWGKNTQWAGRQLTVGLTVPLAAFGVAAAKAFREADAELTRLTKVYGGLARTSSEELARIREDVAATAKELSAGYGVSFKESISLAADIAATGKEGTELLGSLKETSRLAVLGEVDRQEAMKATLAVQSAFKQNTDQLSDSINFLNAVENQTSTTLADLVEAIPKAGPVIQGLGGSVQDLALYLTAMREGGVNATEGANALKSSLASLINPTKVATEKFAELGIDLKGIVTNNAGNLTATLLELQAALDKLDPLQKQQAIEQLFGKFQFSRLNALFNNLGKEGSQTLQVLELMKASTQELGAIADRELKAVTESAAGKYNRAIESLRANLAEIGEEFLKVQTFFINVTDSIVKFVNNLPGPIKQILTFAGGLTAIIGPVIMLTGVLANFFGYIIKGVAHFKALFKGGEGWRMLTPEILAAEKAGSLVEKTFYSDAKAASVLKTSIEALIAEFTLLEQKAKSGAISLAPAFTTMAGNPLIGSRVVDPNHPLISAQDTRSMSHLNPVAGMTQDERLAQTIFGVVPGAPKVNQRIGANPQIYMQGDLPKVPGLTSIKGVSTGIVAEEAAKWHAMTGALAMQSQAEIAKLKKEVATTGLITAELSDSYQALLPSMTTLTQKAAQESAAIVAQLQAGKITVDQARAKIIALNKQIEMMIAQSAADIAAQQGRTINMTSVPLLNQPIVNPEGKSNMKELARPGRTRDLLNKIARGLGVKTFGAPYSIETTRPKRFATGDIVPGSGNTDKVPAMLTPGEFVVRKDAVNQTTLPLLRAINEGGSGFMPAMMIHQGREANQALAGNRPSINLTGAFLADDLQQLHARGLHPMAMFYEQGLRLGYDKTDLQRALKLAYRDIVRTFSAKGNVKVNNKYFEKVAGGIAMKYLKGVSRVSPTLGRRVRFAEELLMMGHQRNESGKGILKGSLRNVGFDNVTMPRHLVGTGSGFSGGQNLTHFNLAQELYDETPANRYTGPLGRGSTITQVFGSERGHIGPKIAPSRYNLLLKTLQAKLSRAPMPRRVRFNNGGMVKGVQYLQDGDLVRPAASEGFMANARYSTRRMTSFGSAASGMGSGVGAQIGIGLGATVAGSMVGGQTGQAIQMAGLAASFLPIHRVFSAIKGIASSGSALKSIAGLLGRLAPPVAVITTILGVGAGLMKLKKHYEDVGKANRAAFAPTEKTMSEVGLTYVSFTDKLKEVQDQLKLTREANISAFQALNKTGVSGLTLTIKELNEAIADAKENAKDTIQNFNKLSGRQDVLRLAASLKQQYISAGMSVEEATNKIYALIKASNKGAYAIGAITSEAFTAITDKASAAQYQVELLIKTLSDKKSFNAEELAMGIDNMLNALMSYQQSLVGTKDKNNELITQTKAVQITLDKIRGIKGSNLKLDEKTVDQIKSQNLVLGSVLNKNETLLGVYAKAQLLLNGFGGKLNLSNMDSNTAADIASGMQAWGSAATAATEDVKGPLSSLNKKYNDLTTSIKNATTAAKNLSNTKSIDDQIKAIDRLIKKIKEETDARLKALDVQQKNADIEKEIQDAQIEYQQAVAVGDMAAAARAKLNIQKLMDDRARELARQAIIDKSDAELKKLEKQREALSDKASGAQLAATNQNTAAQNNAAAQAALGTFRTTISGILAGETPKTLAAKMKDKNASQEIAGAVDRALKALIDAGGVAKAEAERIKKQFGIDGKGSVTGQFKLLQSLINLTSDKAESGAFSSAVDKFVNAVDKFARNNLTGDGTSAKPFAMGRVAGLSPQSWQTPFGGVGMNSTREQIKKYAERQGFMSGDHFTLASGNKSDKTYKEYKFRVQPDGNIMLVETKMGGFAMGGLIGRKKYATAGLIKGPGTGTSDSIPIMASNGEYMFSELAARNIGYDNLEFLHKLGRMGMPAFDVPTKSKINFSGMPDSSSGPVNIVNNMSVYAQPGQDAREIATIAVNMIETKTARSIRQGGANISYGGNA